MTEQQTDPVLPFRLLGKRYVVKPMEISATLVRECRAETGFAPNQLFALFGGPGVDLDVLAALVWLARRQAGEPAILRRGRATTRLITDVEDGLTYDALHDLELEDPDEEPVDPQA